MKLLSDRFRPAEGCFFEANAVGSLNLLNVTRIVLHDNGWYLIL